MDVNLGMGSRLTMTLTAGYTTFFEVNPVTHILSTFMCQFTE